MESRIERTRLEEDANVFLHKAKAPQGDIHRVFNGASSLIALARWAPEKVQTVKEIESEITLFPGSLLALERRTGLKEKRICDKETRVIDLAMKAVDEMIRRKTWDGEPLPFDEIDLIIYFSVSREYEEPATAVLIQERLGLSGQMAFDVSDACMGFIDAWCIADAMIATRRVRKALLVGAEKTILVSENAVKAANSGGDIFDQYASLTLGNGAVAAVVGFKSHGKRGINLKAGIRETYGEYSNLCILKSYNEGIMRTQAKQLFEAGRLKFAPVDEALISHLKWSKNSIDIFVPHQASMATIKQGCEVLGVPFEKNIVTFPQYGNMASVHIPFTLSLAMDNLKVWGKQKILCTGLASGLGIGALGLETYSQ